MAIDTEDALKMYSNESGIINHNQQFTYADSSRQYIALQYQQVPIL